MSRPGIPIVRRVAVIAIALIGGIAAACGTAPSPSTPQSTQIPTQSAGGTVANDRAFRTAQCPPDTVGGIEQAVSCGYLRVPESRSAGAPRTIELFAMRVVPGAGTPASDPVIALGFDLPWTPNYPGLASMADRVGREVVILSPRGSGRSIPSLVCTELEELTANPTDLGADPKGVVDMVTRDRFLASVDACRQRLVSDGIDLSAYNLVESAADVEDLRRAFGFESYNLSATGSSTRIAFEVLRRYPDAVRSAVLTSPSAPQVDMFTAAVLGSRASLAATSEACAAARPCNESFPDLSAAMADGLARLADQPIWIGELPSMPIDDAMLVRLARGGFSSGYLPNMPAAIYHFVVNASAEHDTQLEVGIHDWPILSRGFVAESEPWDINEPPWHGDYSHGLLFSMACREHLPNVDRDALIAETADEPWYAKAFLGSGFADVCDRWAVSSDQTSRDPMTSDVPTLMLVGHFDPFGSPSFAELAADTLSQAWVVEIPTGSYNVLGMDIECPRSIRDAWIDGPTSPPDTSCIAGMPPIRWSEAVP